MSKQTEELKLALNKAFQLGQRYWSWADSEYSSHWKKADAAKAELDKLVKKTYEAIANDTEHLAHIATSTGTQISKVWWDDEKLMAKPIDQTTIYQEPAQPERQSFSEWTSDYVQDNLHKLKPEQEQWDAIPDAFNEWWNADYDDTGNPYRKDSPAYWAWSGWKAASKQLAQQEPACQWKREDDHHMPGTWRSDCGVMWTFTDGSPVDNEMKYCCGCGAMLLEKKT